MHIALHASTRDFGLRLGRLWSLFRRFCGLTSGRSALECVQEPSGLRFPLSRRAKRMIHDSQMSTW